MRNISFALTTEQIRNRTKTVTRRLGWKNLQPGTLLQPVVKAQGLKKGEHVEKIGGPIRVVKVYREGLSMLLLRRQKYCREEVDREGFTDLTPAEFVMMFARTHGMRSVDQFVTRILFEYIAYCVQCRCEIAGLPGDRGLCGECGCEDDGDIW